jgi:S1-C subfamily serine protease
MARNVLEQIIRNGEVVRGWLGVGIRDSENGVLIIEVAPGGPAAHAGLQVGDIIQDVDGERMDDERELRLTVSDMAPGREIQVRVSRAGPSRDFTLKVGRFPDRSPTDEPRFH